MTPESETERYRKGRELLEEMLGKKGAEATSARFKELHPQFEKWVTEFVMADIYARPGLDLKTRLLCTVAALTVMGRQEQLKVHLERAVGAGATIAELDEVILQMSAFGGFPATWDALATARAVLGIGKNDLPSDRTP
jgi:4-carboxymuconolactone decarboxylase